MFFLKRVVFTENLKYFNYFRLKVGKKGGSSAKEKNRRLDLFLEKLEIEKKKKEKILGFVEELTTDVLKKKSQPVLRLNKAK